jgi:hypothetical protein
MLGHLLFSKSAHAHHHDPDHHRDHHQHGRSHCACHEHNEHRHACASCEIPQTHCPPRIAGKIEWPIERGATPEAVIVVRNIATIPRAFVFSATALAGLGGGSASLSITPLNATLAAGESVIVRVSLSGSDSLTACQDYRAEVVIKGAWEQAVKVLCRVAPDPFDSCIVDQSDSLRDRVLHPETYKSGVAWQFERGVVPEASITAFNTGKASRVFSFVPTPIAGAEGTLAALVVTPDSAMLSPGQSVAVRLQLQHSETLNPGQHYKAALVVRGFYDQRLHVHSHVERDPSGHVEVDQGDAPTYLRAHHWYDHFQCTLDCAAE